MEPKQENFEARAHWVLTPLFCLEIHTLDLVAGKQALRIGTGHNLLFMFSLASSLIAIGLSRRLLTLLGLELVPFPARLLTVILRIYFFFTVRVCLFVIVRIYFLFISRISALSGVRIIGQRSKFWFYHLLKLVVGQGIDDDSAADLFNYRSQRSTKE